MKSILITGASSGIGKATAELFLGAGWRVGLVARRAAALEEIAAAHEAAMVLPGDVTDAAAMQEVFARFAAKAGRLDALFNNAGIFGAPGAVDEIDVADFEEVMSVNLRGMFICAREAFGLMRRQTPRGGRIINNGSISAHVPRPGSVSYTVTKHAITGLTRSLSLDGRDLDIACGQIDIGNAETGMVADLNARLIGAGQPPNPTMDVMDAARSVLHMAMLPLNANVQFMTVMATKMPYIGRG